jgi:hypothetical protein
LKEKQPDALRFELLKLLYEEVGRNFRHYLSWRRILVAGYLATLAGLAIGLSWAVKTEPCYEFIFPAGAALASALFWALDYRTRSLFSQAATTGVELESSLGHAGYYTSYQAGRGRFTHTLVISLFLGAAIVVFAALAIVLVARPI